MDKTSAAHDLGLPRSCLYYSPKLPKRDLVLVKQIKDAHLEHPAYGHRRMATHLKVNHKRTERVMRDNNITPPRRKVAKYYTTRSTSDHSYINLIKDIDKSTIPPHHIWVCDLTYVKYDNTFYYLSTIEDLATRRIIGAQVGRHHDSSLVIATIRQAITASGGILPTYFHTDQGKEFIASGTTEYLELQGVKVSVSDKGSPWQNGYKESFFGRFKEEFGDFNRFDTPGQLIEEIYSQIHYYNYKRIHSAFDMSPVNYTQQLLRSV